jgi:hypothetical protein
VESKIARGGGGRQWGVGERSARDTENKEIRHMWGGGSQLRKAEKDGVYSYIVKFWPGGHTSQ